MNNFSPLVREVGTVLFDLVLMLTAVFILLGYIIKKKVPEKNKTMTDALISAINPMALSIVTAVIAAVALYLLTLIIHAISFSWEFVGIVYVISLIFWMYIAIEHGD